MENKKKLVALFLLCVLSFVLSLFTMSIAVSAFYAGHMGMCFFAAFVSYINLSNFIKGMTVIKSIEAGNGPSDQG